MKDNTRRQTKREKTGRGHLHLYRITATIMALMLSVGSLPVSAFAADTSAFSSGQAGDSFPEKVMAEEPEPFSGSVGLPEMSVTEGMASGDVSMETSAEDAVQADTSSEETDEFQGEMPEEYTEDMAQGDLPEEDASALSYTVTLDANGGYFSNEWDDVLNESIEKSEVINKVIAAGESVTAYPVIDQKDTVVSFLGWSTERDGEPVTVGDEGYIPTGDCMLYAVWSAESESVTESDVSSEDISQNDSDNLGDTDTDIIDSDNTSAEEDFSGEEDYQEDQTDPNGNEDNSYNQEDASLNESVNQNIEREENTGDGENSSQEDIPANETEESETSESSESSESESEETDFENDSQDIGQEIGQDISGHGNTDSETAESDNGETVAEGFENTIDDSFAEDTGVEDGESVTESQQAGTEDAGNGESNPSDTGSSETGTEDFVVENGVLTAYTGEDTSITIPADVKEIGASVFKDNSALESVEFPEGLEKIGDYAFQNCTGLKGALELPDSLTGIGSYAFYGCSGLTGALAIPAGVATVSAYAFYNCSGFSSLSLPEGLRSIGSYAFYRCSGMKGDLVLPEGLTGISGYAFYGCSGFGGDLAIHAGVSVIYEDAFCGCKGFSSLSLPEGLTQIRNYAFDGCSMLGGTLEIPDSVKTMDKCAFRGCSKIEEVIFGSGLTAVSGSDYYGNCFGNCASVRTVTFLSQAPPYITGQYLTDKTYGYASSLFGSSGLSKLTTIYVLPDSLQAYKTAYSNIPSRITISADTLTMPVSKLSKVCAASHSAEISWNAAISESIIGYRVYRDDVMVSEAQDTHFFEDGLTENTTYTYKVVGYTESNEETAPSTIQIETKKPQVLSVNSENGYAKVGLTKSNLIATVSDTGNLRNASGQFYYVDEEENEIPIGSALSDYTLQKTGVAAFTARWDVSQLEAGTYNVIFELTDRDGESARAENQITVENSIPEAVSNVTAVGDTNQIVLSWSKAHEVDTQKYHIYRRNEEEDEFRLIKKIFSRDTLSYTDTRADQPVKYYYYITTVNSLGTEGTPSQTAVAVPRTDTEAPRVVQLTPVSGSVIGGKVELYANAQDNVAAVKTELYVSADDGETWELLHSRKSNYDSYVLDTADYDVEFIKIKGVAYDAAGNESTGLVNSYKIDNQGPEKVTGLSYESTATTITLRWEDVADQDFSFFRVEREKSEGEFVLVQDVYKTLGVNIYGLKSDTEYRYRVAAYDQLGNRGEASDVITASTQKDTINPVITAIAPAADYYNKAIPVVITAKDNTAVSSIRVQYSSDAAVWNDFRTVEFNGTKQTEKASVSFAVDEMPEGNLFIRGVAEDIYGNTSDASPSAPYVQYILDFTAPAAPSGVTASAVTGAIEVKWDMGAEEDIDDYIVYRSSDGETFTKIMEGLHYTNYWDRQASRDVTYTYKLAVRDQAGNKSPDSETVTAVLPQDEENPQILSFVPESGSTVGPSNSEFKLLASDNWKLDSILVTYTVNGSEQQKVLLNSTGITDYYRLFSAALPIDQWKDGDTIHLTATVTDAQGLTAVQSDITYTVDKSAPRVNSITTKGDKEKIRVSWTGGKEEDLAGYRIYRRKAGGSWSVIAQRSAKTGVSDYFYDDFNALPRETYYYKVEALDKCGNSHTRESEAVWILVEPEVRAALNVAPVMEKDVEYYWDASGSFADLGISEYAFDFGDGSDETGTSARVVHRYTETGVYEAKLTVTDSNGGTSVRKVTITVEEAKLLGSVSVKVVDADGNPVSEMPVFWDLDNTSDNIGYTDSKGFVSFIAGAGAYSVGAYMDGYLPVKSSVAVRAGTETNITLTIVKEPIVTGEFEVNRMTLDEIIAAGIDVTDPANQQLVRMMIHLEYGNTPVTMNIVTNGKKIYSGGTTIVDTSEGRRQLTATVIDLNEGGSAAGGSSQNQPENQVVAIMDIPVGASYLKEFFDVKLHIVNHADPQFILKNNTVTLDVPEGMSLVESLTSLASETAFFDELAGQEQKTLSWILRGDQAGEYELTADYSAVLDQFDQPVSATFKTDNPIKVYGLDAMKIIADINTRIVNGGLYFDLSLQNVGDAQMYLPDIGVGNSVLVEYEKKAGASGGEEYTPAIRDVKMIGAEIRNMDGYVRTLDALDYSSLEVGGDDYDSQIREKNLEVSSLAAGEMLTKKYVCYDSVTSDDILYLIDAVKKVAKDYGIAVEINRVDMDLFAGENAEEKARSFYTDKSKNAIYRYFIDYDNENFYYYIQALQDDNDIWKKLGEAFYRSTDCVLNLDWDLFTNENAEDITRKYVVNLLEDEGFHSAVDTKINDTYLSTTKKVLSAVKAALPDTEGETGYDAFKDALGEAENIRSLAGVLKTGGSDAFYDRLIGIAGSAAAGDLVERLKNHFSRDDVIGWTGEAFSSELGNVSKVLGYISKGVTAWNKSVELTNQLVTINAAQFEAEELFRMILNHPEINKVVYQEIEKEYEGLQKGFDSQSDLFVEEYLKAEANGQISKGVDKVIDMMDDAFGFKEVGIATVISAMKLGFSTLDYIFKWEDKVDALQELRVSATLTYALRAETLDSRFSMGQEEHFLNSLKYLIKMRIIGEKAYFDIVKKEKQEANILASINAEYTDAQFKSIDDYYKMFRSRALSYRDILYGDIVTPDGIPDAPVVTVDYVNETLQDVLGDLYEYSYDGENWTTFDDQKLALNPSSTGKHLWVRRKASADNLAGSITKLFIPARSTLPGKFTARYKAGTYTIEGPAGEYVYLLSDQPENPGELTGCMTIKEGTAAQTDGERYYPYLTIARSASDFSFRTNSKVIAVEEDLTAIDINTLTITGITDKTYTGKSQTQTIIVRDGDTRLTLGTDYNISYANNINAGTARIMITGIGNYTGRKEYTFKINRASQTITASNLSLTYPDSGKITVSGNKGGISFKSSKTAVATVDMTGKVTSKSAGSTTITITAAATSNYKQATKQITVTVAKGTQSLTAKAAASSVAVGKTTTVSITGAKGTKSFKSSDTRIATIDKSTGVVTAKKVGTVKITAASAATANYKAASKTVTIKVVPAATSSLTAANQGTGIKLTWKKVAGANGYKVYRGSTLIKTITSGSTVTFTDTRANTNGTKYTYKVIAKASTGTSTLSRSRVFYRVSRSALSAVTNSAASKIIVKWGKNAKATGYQIQYSTSRTFASGNKTAGVAGAATVSRVIGSLTRGKTYYVRIRTYKTVGSVRYWSAWSAAKSVKIIK